MKTQLIALSEIPAIDYSRNVRNMADYTDLNDLKADLTLQGQLDEVELHRKGAVIDDVLRGYRRITAMLQLAAAGVICEATGKPFTHVKAFVYENLSEEQKLERIIDEGQRKGLDRIGLTISAVKLFEVGKTEKEVVVKLAGLFNSLYPPKRVLNGPVDLLDNHKGTLQAIKEVYKSPFMLRNAWFARMRGEQKWPVIDDVRQLVKVYEKERDADPLHKIDRANPGPEFLKAWAEFEETWKKAEETGNKPKPLSMQNRDQVEKKSLNSKSRVLRIASLIILNKIDNAKWIDLDTFLFEQVEAKISDIETIIDGILKK